MIFNHCFFPGKCTEINSLRLIYTYIKKKKKTETINIIQTCFHRQLLCSLHAGEHNCLHGHDTLVPESEVRTENRKKKGLCGTNK